MPHSIVRNGFVTELSPHGVATYFGRHPIQPTVRVASDEELACFVLPEYVTARFPRGRALKLAADAASALVDEPRVSVTTLRRKFGLVADIDCLLVMMFGVGETMWVVDENGLSKSRFWFVTLLDLATILRDEQGVRELLEKGARPAVPDLSDALTHCLVGHPWREPPDLELAQLLVDAGADVNTTGLRNYPRLIKVIEACNTDDATKASLVSFLLENGADVNLCKDDRCADGRVGVGPLFKAAQEGLPRCVKVLLDAGAKVDVVQDTGATPLFIAAHEGNERCVALLLAARAAFTIVANDGHTAMSVAEAKGRTKVVALLEGAGARRNWRTKEPAAKKPAAKKPAPAKKPAAKTIAKPVTKKAAAAKPAAKKAAAKKAKAAAAKPAAKKK